MKKHTVESKAKKQSEKRGKINFNHNTPIDLRTSSCCSVALKVVAELLLPFFQLPSDTRN